MDIADQIARLDDLRVRGVLSDDEFIRAKARVINGGPAGPRGDVPALDAINRLRRSRIDRWVGGVCGGLAAMTGVESWIWRLIVATLALFGGAGVVMYALLWIFVPEE